MDNIVLTSLALAAHIGGHGFGFGWIFFFLIPLFWIGVVVLIVGLARRRGMRGGWGPRFAGHPGWANPARAAETTLAERFAQGDIDEKEYRARLEVLRANNGFNDQSRK